MRRRTPPRAAEIRGWIFRQIQAQAERWSLWTPVAFGCGCGAYFALKSEPGLAIVGGIAVLTVLLAWALRLWGRAPTPAGLVLLVAFGACGMLSGKLQTLAMRGPVCPPLAGVTVEGCGIMAQTPQEITGI